MSRARSTILPKSTRASLPDLIALALLRQLLRQGVLSDMDAQAMAADLARDGHAAAAHSVNVAYVEAVMSVTEELAKP